MLEELVIHEPHRNLLDGHKDCLSVSYQGRRVSQAQAGCNHCREGAPSVGGYSGGLTRGSSTLAPPFAASYE
jgi:hypothetical protein